MFFSALLIGFLGSSHCIAMCSPITLLLGKAGSTAQFITQRLIYNTGRVVGYITLGLLAGLVGKIINLSGLQQWFSIGVGVLLLLAVFMFDSQAIYNPSLRPLQKAVVFLRSRFVAIRESNRSFKGFYIGLFNGFLPCGLVYMAVIGAVTMDSVFDSMLYMLVFGLGTWPMMLLVSFSSGWLSKFSNAKMLKIIPAIVALLFIFRGLGLGIPYLSPSIDHSRSGDNAIECVQP